MRCALLVGALSVAAAASSAGAYYTGVASGDRVVRLYPGDESRLSEQNVQAVREILAEVDVWGTSEDGAMEMLIKESQSANLTFLSSLFRIEDSTEFHNTHFSWFKENFDSQVCIDEPDVCAGVHLNATASSRRLLQLTDPFYSAYQRLAAIRTRLSLLVDRNPTTHRLRNWGNSFLGQQQSGIAVTSTVGGTNKPIVFYFCGEHAREWLPPMFCVFLAEELGIRYRAGEAQIVSLLDRFEFHVLPVMNPDGYEHSHTTSSQWRKSRRPNTGSTCIGTDLNRNYQFQWNTGGSSNDPCSDTFHGGVPSGFFNNPETANLRDYFNSVGTRVRVAVDVHAYGQMWMHAYGYSTVLPPAADTTAMVNNGNPTVTAIRGVNGLTFAMGSIARVIYVASGSSVDYFYGTHRVVQAWAPEVRGTSFQPPATNIRPSNLELWAGFIAQVTRI